MQSQAGRLKSRSMQRRLRLNFAWSSRGLDHCIPSPLFKQNNYSIGRCARQREVDWMSRAYARTTFIPKPKERGTGFLNFLTKIPGEIRGHELIRRRAGMLALRTNPFSPTKPVKMMIHGGLRPSKPPEVHTFFIHVLAVIGCLIGSAPTTLSFSCLDWKMQPRACIIM